MRSISIACWPLLITLGLPALAFGQAPPLAPPAAHSAPAATTPARPGPAPAKPLDPKRQSQTPQQIRETMHQSIRAWRKQRLADVVQPDAPTALKIQDILDQHAIQTMALGDELRKTKAELTRQLKLPAPDLALLTRLTDQLLAVQAKIAKVEEDRSTAVRKVLTPVQFSRYLIAWPKINRQIQEKIYQALAKIGDRTGTRDEF